MMATVRPGGDPHDWASFRNYWYDDIVRWKAAWENAARQGNSAACLKFWSLWEQESIAWREMFDPEAPPRQFH